MSNPIGVFDSGIGGLTVLKVLIESFPNQDFIYLGDTARLPYGTKSPATIRKYLLQASQYLIDRGCQVVVVACNSASTQLHESEIANVPCYNVIDPGVEVALEVSQNGLIGVLGTRATIASQEYQNRIQARARLLGREVQVSSQACPLFVPLVEEGWTNDPITNLIAYRYVSAMASQGLDTLVMGCTHYPMLKTALGRALGPSVQLVEGSHKLAQWIGASIQNIQGPNIQTGSSTLGSTEASAARSTEGRTVGRIELCTTDSSTHFWRLAQEWLSPLRIESFEEVAL